MKIQKNLIFIFLSFVGIGFFCSSWASANAHDFSSQLWSHTRSCTICHIAPKGIPSLTPPDARLTVDLAHLTDVEAQAVGLHPSNRLCYVCHKTNTDSNGAVIGHSTVGGINSGALPTIPNGSPLPPSTGNGTTGSVVVRVNSKGPKGVDCLGCHDVHNVKTDHLLRDDYGQTQDP